MWRQASSPFLTIEASISPINKHFIQWRFHWIMSKIFRFLLCTWRTLAFPEWVTRSRCYWYRPMLPTNKAPPSRFPRRWSGAGTAQHFPDTNQQVTWHRHGCLLIVSPWLSENKRQYLFSGALQADHMESKVFYFSHFSFSRHGGKLPTTTAMLVTSYTTDVWRCKNRNETKNSLKKFCINKNLVCSYHNCEKVNAYFVDLVKQREPKTNKNTDVLT